MKSLLIATQALTYGTRRLRAGDSFIADQGDGPVYVTLGLAKQAMEETIATVPGLIDDDKAKDLRLDYWRKKYEAMYGQTTDGRWGIDRIRKEIEKR